MNKLTETPVGSLIGILSFYNGKEFKNEILKNLFKKYFISARFGRVRHPQSQGIVERANQTLMRRLSKCLHGKGVRWFDSIGKLFLYFCF
jgi:transposase InsO family protein